MKNAILFTLCLGYLGQLIGQNTIGLLSFDHPQSYEGYNLIYPHNQPNVYLLDNCGEIVHLWADDIDFRPGNTAYLTDEGNLIKAKRPSSIAGNPIWAGGGGGTVEIRDWDNNLLWSYTLNDENDRLHHDIAPMSNGNILMIAWELMTEEEAIEAGRDTALLGDAELWPDYIIEVEPDLESDTFDIVWEWHTIDHLIQDYDSTKANFGVVGDHPELIDFNFDTRDGQPDWMHSNALDYDPFNDLVLLSIPAFDEVWIIDHTTTTEQAAGHTGGFSGRGGDLMYRWGNPAAYRAGTAEDQKLFFQHDAHFVDDFISPSHPAFGRIAVFNNRITDTSSTVNYFNPSFEMYTFSFPFENGVFGPADFEFTYGHPIPERMQSTGLSSFQLLPNGNSLITAGRHGYSFELNMDNEIIWEYVTPLISGSPASQGDTLSINNNLTFRMTRYPLDFSGFDERDLTPMGFIELNPNTTFCSLIVSTLDLDRDPDIFIYPNPVDKILTVEWNKTGMAQFNLYNSLGQLVDQFGASGGRNFFDMSAHLDGTYFLQMKGGGSKVIFKSGRD